MLGNSHVQFLGGWARATAPGYPSKSSFGSHYLQMSLQSIASARILFICAQIKCIYVMLDTCIHKDTILE